MNNNALIGHTGFVGGHLKSHFNFSHLYNSSNINDIRHKTFKKVFCAGAPAIKWFANKNPDLDHKSILNLIESLKNIKADELILISTVDVYGSPNQVSENDAPYSTQAYGKHRLQLERFIQKKFKNTRTIRLPGLFGSGLKKNLIFDFLNSNETNKINSEDIYQWYPITNLWQDINTLLKSNIKLIHFATEPILNSELIKAAFGINFKNPKEAEPTLYDFKSLHAKLYNKQGDYLYNKKEILFELKAYITNENNLRNS